MINFFEVYFGFSQFPDLIHCHNKWIIKYEIREMLNSGISTTLKHSKQHVCLIIYMVLVIAGSKFTHQTILSVSEYSSRYAAYFTVIVWYSFSHGIINIIQTYSHSFPCPLSYSFEIYFKNPKNTEFNWKSVFFLCWYFDFCVNRK